MTLVTSYDDTDRLGRIRLSFTGYDALADYAVVERSLDQVNWTVIRGGDTVPLTGGAGSIDDYEFAANQLNYYRVTAWNTGGAHFVGKGTAAAADNASVVPTIPAGSQAGDLMYLYVANRSFTATVNTPAGWTLSLNFNHVRVFEKIHSGSESNPTVSFTGSVAGDTCQAQIATFRFVKMTSLNIQSAFNNSQDIPFPSIHPAVYTDPMMLAIAFGWKQDDCTSVDPVPGWNDIDEATSALGNDQTIVWAYQNFREEAPAGTFVVQGGTSTSNRGLVGAWEATYTNRETTSITPVVTRYRLKCPTRPSLNMFIEPVQDSFRITRPARTGVFDVLSRTLPVAVTDLQGSRRFALKIDVKGDQNKADTDNRLSTGQVYFLQPPSPTEALPTAYVVLGDVGLILDTPYFSDSYTFALDMTEVAAPASSVFGGTTIWQDIINDFATWSDLIAAEPTWADVIDRISDSDVIVP